MKGKAVTARGLSNLDTRQYFAFKVHLLTQVREVFVPTGVKVLALPAGYRQRGRSLLHGLLPDFYLDTSIFCTPLASIVSCRWSSIGKSVNSQPTL